MTDIELHDGDSGPGPRVQLLDDNGDPQSLVGGTVVLEVDGDPTPSAVTVVDADTGIVRVPRDDALTTPDGKSKAQFLVSFKFTDASGNITHFPTRNDQAAVTYRDLVPET